MYCQEQEHWDYEMGARSELQNAFALSKMEAQLRDPKIDQELAKGKIVLVISCPAYCPRTDACMGEHSSLHSIHETRDEARNAMETCDVPEEYRLHIEPPPSRVPDYGENQPF